MELLENRKPLWFVFVHDHWFCRTWTYVMHILLIYTAFNIPLNVAFDQSDNQFLTSIDAFIDYMFICDLFMNFIMGYENEDRNSEFRLKKIAIRYMSSWFFIDFVACLPIDKVIMGLNGTNELNIEAKGDQNANKLFRLARLPRLYRLIRIVRLLRLLKMGNSFQKIFAVMKINNGVSKLINIMITVLFLIHLYACLWYWLADFLQEADGVDYWVRRGGWEEDPNYELYMRAVYWSF